MPGWAAAFRQLLAGLLGLTGRGWRVDAVLQVVQRLHRHAERGDDPFLARQRTDYFQAAGCPDAAQLGHQEVLR